VYSDDYGATWHIGADVTLPGYSGENQLVQLPTGELLTSMRVNGACWLGLAGVGLVRLGWAWLGLAWLSLAWLELLLTTMHVGQYDKQARWLVAHETPPSPSTAPHPW
jgi:hypothetical protein